MSTKRSRIQAPTQKPDGYKRINVHLIFDVKQTLKRKARLVAGGNMTDPPKDSVYSGVVSLQSLRIISFLAEFNGLELMAADIGNAYLEAHTKEKVYCIAGSEFGELAGHIIVLTKLVMVCIHQVLAFMNIWQIHRTTLVLLLPLQILMYGYVMQGTYGSMFALMWMIFWLQ